MHDVLAHRISQISLHAGAVAFRGVLGVLRDPDTGELLSRPQPALDDIPALVAGARESGTSVEYTAHIDRSEGMPLVVGVDVVLRNPIGFGHLPPAPGAGLV